MSLDKIISSAPKEISGSVKYFADHLFGKDGKLTDNYLDICNDHLKISSVYGKLEPILKTFNHFYRHGMSLIPNEVYDANKKILEFVDPESGFVTEVESEDNLNEKTVKLPEKMLSTNKAYTEEKIDAWASKLRDTHIKLKGDKLGLDTVVRLTPKLDGWAGYKKGDKLYTRGDGEKGSDISILIERGMKCFYPDINSDGPGEIVVSREWFDKNLTGKYENTRNAIAAAVSSEPPQIILDGIKGGHITFVSFKGMKGMSCLYTNVNDGIGFMDTTISAIKEAFEPENDGFLKLFRPSDDLVALCDFDMDGIVAEAIDEDVKATLGSNNKHHRWQIAFKENDNIVEATVVDIYGQVGRTGNITPVINVDPVTLDGVTVTKATAHNFSIVNEKGIGLGAKILLTRSGKVIPTIVEVIKPSTPYVLETCPCCNADAIMDGKELKCTNPHGCEAQLDNSLVHFFDTLGNLDGFGPSTINRMTKAGIRSLPVIYASSVDNFIKAGCGKKTAQNLVDNLELSRKREISDARFLAAFGVPKLGEGRAKKLLSKFTLEDIFDVSAEDISKLKDFGDVTGDVISQGLRDIKELFFKIYDLGFNIKYTNIVSDDEVIDDSNIVFTGSFTTMSRKEYEKDAKDNGIKIGSKVTSKTRYLVVGLNPGNSKLKGADKHSIRKLTEEQYDAIRASR